MNTRNQHGNRGRLTIYLGYAAGVGKTFQMLVDAHHLAQGGVDVVIGYLEPHGRKDTIVRSAGLEFIPRRRIAYRGSVFEEMDLEAVRQRRPSVCLMDELAHTNVPGSEHPKRWEDAIALLEAGIDVYTTLNIQHLESLNDRVFQITGIRVRETLPDWVFRQADEIVMVDLTPRALLNRLRRGAVYPQERVKQALENFFKESTLTALRELALRDAAHEVNVRHVELPEIAAEEAAAGEHAVAAQPDAGHPPERILAWVTTDSSAAVLIRRARRVADFLRARCYAVYVHTGSDIDRIPADKRERIERTLNFARNLHIETRLLYGRDIARQLIDFARLHEVTQILVARPRYGRWQWLSGRQLIHRIVREARDKTVTIVAAR